MFTFCLTFGVHFKFKRFSFYIFSTYIIKFAFKKYLLMRREGFYIKSNQNVKKIFHALFPLIIGGIVGIITSNSMDYNDLIKPTLAPPEIVFPIAWTIIYLLIGISYTLLKEKSTSKQDIFLIFAEFLQKQQKYFVFNIIFSRYSIALSAQKNLFF